jgi:hypothetical protein
MSAREQRNVHYWKLYQKTGEDTVDWEDLVRAVVDCRLCELAIALELLRVAIFKSSINPITSPNHVYNHSNTWQYIDKEGNNISGEELVLTPVLL